MSAPKVLIGGVALAVSVYLITFALHLLNQASDVAVAGGYLILLLLFAGAAEGVRRFRNARVENARTRR
jgi:hypothetical protein